MSYETHLSAVIAAFLQAVPGMTPRRLSREAGLSAGWVSEFQRTGRANVDKADCLLRTVRRLCPDSAAGDPLRDLLWRLDTLSTEGGAA